MTRDEHGPLSETARAELAAIDGALQGGPVTADHSELGDLALLLRDDRPRPEEQFAARLDERAAHGFRPAPGDAGPPARAPHADGAGVRRRRATRSLWPAVAVTITAIVAIAVALVFVGQHGGGRHASPELAAPAAGGTASRADQLGTARPEDLKSESAAVAEAPSSPSSGARQVESGASLNVGVAHARFASADQQVFSIISSFHGYVQQSSSTSGSEQQGSATFQLRVPSASAPGTIGALSQLGRVLSETNTTNDVTDRLDSLQRSLGDARAERAGLLRQLVAASGSQQAEALRARLRAVEAQISELQASLGSLMSNVDYATISLTLTGERAAGTAAPQGDLTPGGAVRDAGQILSAALAVFLLAAAATLPVAIALLIGWAAVVSLRRRQREQALDAG